MNEITGAALQLAVSTDAHANIARVADMVREAAGKCAQVVLPPELFEGEYFCRVEDEGLFAAAKPTAAHSSVIAMPRLADDLGIWITTSFFVADEPHHYNSLALFAPGGNKNGRAYCREQVLLYV